MSTQALIEDSLSHGTLRRLHPWNPATKLVRLIYLSPTVFEYVQSDEIRAGLLHQTLDVFIGGAKITITMTPRKKQNTAYMGLLDPIENGILDIRSIDPAPALRILGAFARKDHFIGLVHRFRKEMLTENDWTLAIEECRREWKKRFHALLPIVGDNPNDYLSNYSCVD